MVSWSWHFRLISFKWTTLIFREEKLLHYSLDFRRTQWSEFKLTSTNRLTCRFFSSFPALIRFFLISCWTRSMKGKRLCKLFVMRESDEAQKFHRNETSLLCVYICKFDKWEWTIKQGRHSFERLIKVEQS